MKKGLPLLIIAALIVGVAMIAIYFKNKPQLNASPLISEETASWKTYANNNAKISIETPTTWTAVDEGFGVTGSESERITLEGKEGKVQIDWGSGFGGACPQGYETLKLYSKTVEFCRIINNDGTESWYLSIGKVNNTGYAGSATVNKPYASNQEVILKILSTLKFTQ